MKTNTHFTNLIQFSILLLFICGLACTAGCTSAGTGIEVKQTPAISRSKHKTITVVVTTKDLDFDSKEIDQLTGCIVDGLRKSSKFDTVYAISSDKNDADLKLSVVVQIAGRDGICGDAIGRRRRWC